MEASITPRTRVAIFDDITSNTALRLPAARLARLCRERGVASIVDAAHSVGSSAADDFLDVLHSADVVAGNLHKWACAPRGTGFLHVRSPVAENLEPPIISHGYGAGFASNFAWMGATDPSGLLSVRSLIKDFWQPVGLAKALAYQQHLLRTAVSTLTSAWMTGTLVPVEASANMALVELPLYLRDFTSKGVQDLLHHEHHIEVPIKTVNGRLYVRVSAGIYNDADEYGLLASAVSSIARSRF